MVTALTPIECHGGVSVKRDDLYEAAGQRGGKARTCWHLANAAPRPAGLVTASSRHSPQAIIVANIARALGLPARLHMPAGADTPESVACAAAGATIVRHRPGYNTVIVARAKADAAESGWRLIPFGMQCAEAVEQTAGQVVGIPWGTRRIVLAVGSGMSLAGILTGLQRRGLRYPVLGVVVGADPTRRLDTFAPVDWQWRASLEKPGIAYDRPAPHTHLGDLSLDPIYEAKCLPFLRPADLFWVVGNRVQGA